jgi:hypothetical protein
MADKLPAGVTAADFVAYLPDHKYIFIPTGQFWTAEGVDACLPGVPVLRDGQPVLRKSGPNKGEPLMWPATAWLDRKAAVHHLTWAPGHPSLIRNKLLLDGGWVDRNAVTTFNFYRPPTLKHGDARQAKAWIELVKTVYPEDWQRIVWYLAHCVQRPHEKINHGVVLGGAPGIGKDTMLEPVKHAVGAWNFKEVSPVQLLGGFNGFLRAVVLRVSEMRDLGDHNRYELYEHMKPFLAAPPDVLRINQKYVPEFDALNVVAVIMTTNHLSDGMYLPADDRRHLVCWSELTRNDFEEGYWNQTWSWYGNGGIAHVAAYLAKLSLAAFDAKAPPPKTEAFWTVVNANRAPEEGELADLVDKLGTPDVLTLNQVIKAAGGVDNGPYAERGTIANWLADRKNRRAVPHRLEAVGYVPVRSDTSDGLWVLEGKRQGIYAKAALPLRDRLVAAGQMKADADIEWAARDRWAVASNTPASGKCEFCGKASGKRQWIRPSGMGKRDMHALHLWCADAWFGANSRSTAAAE